jgi:uncharacterized protein YndB with AHSA1/START domain
VTAFESKAMPALPPIRFKTFIAAPASRVFEVLTTARGWDGWFTKGSTLEARVGGALEMRWAGADEANHRVTLWGAGHGAAVVTCPIVALERDRRFAFRWQTGVAPTTVDFRLSQRGAGTVLELTDDGYTSDDLGKVGPTGDISGQAPYMMCSCGWGEALTLRKVSIEHGISYGQVPPA